MLNTRLMAHPMNWLIILLMLIIAGMFGHFVMQLLGQSPAKATANLSTNQTGE